MSDALKWRITRHVQDRSHVLVMGDAAHVACEQIGHDDLRVLKNMMAIGWIRRVVVDCLLFDDEKMTLLQLAIGNKKCVLDFTELMTMPDLVSDDES